MPRKARDERLDTRTARLKLAPRREPYFRTVQEGRAIGYRRLAGGKAGMWIARHYDADRDPARLYHALGAADDTLDADGIDTLTFTQAQDAAGRWFKDLASSGGRVIEPLTVAQAMAAYIEDYTGRGGKALADLRTAINAHILPALGDKQVVALTMPVLRNWHHSLARAPARLRTKADATKRNVRKVAAGDADASRARRATANRVLTVLKAALNLAFRDGQVPTDEAWRRLKPFPQVDAPRVRYLTDDEARRLVNACPPDLRKLVTAALLIGARYGELGRLVTGDFDPDAGVLHIREAKAGKGRSVPLTDEAVRFFTAETAGRARTALLLVREDGGAWGKSHQFRPLREACGVAKIAPAAGFHALRHSFASRLAMKDVPMHVIAAAIGDSEAICAKHYAHLAPCYVADAIRKHAGGLEIVPEDDTAVAPIRRMAARHC